MSRKYSYIYSELVKDPSDVIGLLAYALYKQSKINTIEDFNKTNSRNPSESELQSITAALRNEAQIDLYKSQAQAMFVEISQKIIDDELPKVEQKCTDRHMEMIKDVITSNVPSIFEKELDKREQGLGKQIIIGVASSLCYAIIAFFASVIFASNFPKALKAVIEAFANAN